MEKDLINMDGVLIRYYGEDSIVKIPSNVTEIGNSAFYFCHNLTSVTIPSSVTKIRDYAFYGCKKLKSIEIPNSVRKIDNWAFFNCNSLNSVTIPNSVTSIGGSAFYGCASLKSIEIPNSVTSIGYGAFYCCKNLKSVKISRNVAYIGINTFYGIAKVKPQYNTNGTLRAFKAFTKDWTCRGFQYEIGKKYHIDGKIKCCQNGFHACLNPLDVFNHYYGKLNELHFAEVELSGEMSWGEDKVAASDIKIVRKVSAQDLCEIYTKMEKQ